MTGVGKFDLWHVLNSALETQQDNFGLDFFV